MIANPPHIIRVVKAADETVNNSTTIQLDDELKLAVGVGEKYLVTIDLYTQSVSVNSDLKVGWGYPVNCDIRWGIVSTDVTTWGMMSRAAGSVAATPDFESDTLSIGSRNGYSHHLIHAVIMNGSNAGTVTLMWAQATAVAEDTKVLANSMLIAQPMY